jgi:hypothetical protein
MITAAEITRETKLAHVYETQTCTRCGGGGMYGPRSVYGGRCFKCGGTGATYTKRGAATREFARRILHTTVDGIRPGDKVFYQGFTAGTFNQPSRWVTVDEVSSDGIQGHDKTGMAYNLLGNSEHQVAIDIEIRVALAKLAAEYQESLTKTGKPRKGSRWDA